jgi:hypothetical protein
MARKYVCCTRTSRTESQYCCINFVQNIPRSCDYSTWFKVSPDHRAGLRLLVLYRHCCNGSTISSGAMSSSSEENPARLFRLFTYSKCGGLSPHDSRSLNLRRTRISGEVEGKAVGFKTADFLVIFCTFISIMTTHPFEAARPSIPLYGRQHHRRGTWLLTHARPNFSSSFTACFSQTFNSMTLTQPGLGDGRNVPLACAVIGVGDRATVRRTKDHRAERG